MDSNKIWNTLEALDKIYGSELYDRKRKLLIEIVGIEPPFPTNYDFPNVRAMGDIKLLIELVKWSRGYINSYTEREWEPIVSAFEDQKSFCESLIPKVNEVSRLIIDPLSLCDVIFDHLCKIAMYCRGRKKGSTLHPLNSFKDIQNMLTDVLKRPLMDDFGRIQKLRFFLNICMPAVDNDQCFNELVQSVIRDIEKRDWTEGQVKALAVDLNNSSGKVFNVHYSMQKGTGKVTIIPENAMTLAAAKLAFRAAMIYLNSIGIYGVNLEEKWNIDLQLGENLAENPEGSSIGLLVAIVAIAHVANRQIEPNISMTGQVNISNDSYGKIGPVLGVHKKVKAAIDDGINCILVPEENFHEVEDYADNVRKVANIHDAVTEVFGNLVFGGLRKKQENNTEQPDMVPKVRYLLGGR